MTVARENTTPSPGVSLTPLAARLELLVRRAITVEQFEADMVSGCKAHPDEVWNLLALLDQYHRLERLPTELYRALKAATERYGLVRREPYIPNVTPKPKASPGPGAEPVASPAPDAPPVAASPPAPAPPVAPATPAASASPAPVPSAPAAASPPRPALPQPEAAAASRPSSPDFAMAPSPATGATPFRHLLDDEDDDGEPVTRRPPALGHLEGSRPGDRNVLPTRPPQRSKARAWLLPALLVAVALGAAAWLKQGQGSVNMLAGPDDTAPQAGNPAAVPVPPAAPQAEAAAVPAPSFLSAPVPASAAAAPAMSAAAQSHATPSAAAPPVPPAPAVSPAAVPTGIAAPAPTVASTTPAAPATGPSTIEFAADSYTVHPGDSAARILVRRSGSVSGDLNFVWWTENASAVADVDYVAWGRRAERIPAGRSSVTLLVPIINDSTRTAPRRFQVVIGSADNGARLGAITHATVQLSGSG